jgi:hypothetical protein
MGRGLEYWELLSQVKTFVLEITFGETKGSGRELKQGSKEL